MNKLTDKRGAIKFDRADILYLAAITVIGLAIRLILRVVTTDDWVMYWDPWI